MKKNGLTFIELLVVLFIIGILSMVSLSNYYKNVKETELTSYLSSLNKYKNSILMCLYITGHKKKCDGGKENIPDNFNDNQIKGVNSVIVVDSVLYTQLDVVNPKNNQKISFSFNPVVKENVIEWNVSCSDYNVGSLFQKCEKLYFFNE